MEIAAFGPQAEEAVSETESQIQELEKQLSRTLPDSDVSRINRNGTTPTTGIARPEHGRCWKRRWNTGTPQTARSISPLPP